MSSGTQADGSSARVHDGERVARISAPGNLLVCGEYAVLEPGGLGIAVATHPRTVAEVRPARWDAVRCRMGGDAEHVFVPGQPVTDETRLPATCVAYLERYQLMERPLNAEITLDSSAFFHNDGSKRGLGSSAAATVVCTAALLHAGGLAPAEARRILHEHAGPIHREFQHGHGSGYDVLVSTAGGGGLFRGGPSPSLTPLDLRWLRGALVAKANHAVRTAGAARSFKRWKHTASHEARTLLERSNMLVSELAAADSREKALPILERLAELGIALGERIGVSAALPPALCAEAERTIGGPATGVGDPAPGKTELPPGRASAESGSAVLCKAIGAGNELALCVPRSDTPAELALEPLAHDTIQPLRIASEGVSWDSSHHPGTP